MHAHGLAEFCRCARTFGDFFDFKFPFGRHFHDVEQFNVKNERGIRRNRADAAFAVAHLRRNGERALAALFHADEAFVPAADHLTGTDFELKRFIAVVA